MVLVVDLVSSTVVWCGVATFSSIRFNKYGHLIGHYNAICSMHTAILWDGGFSMASIFVAALTFSDFIRFWFV